MALGVASRLTHGRPRVEVEQREVGVEQDGRTAGTGAATAGRAAGCAAAEWAAARRVVAGRLVAGRVVAGRALALAVVAVAVVAVLPVLPLQAAAAEPAGRWSWPVDGPPSVVRPFAPGPTRYSPGHYGADLGARPGRPVRAAGAGRVSYAGLLAGRGVVVVEHGGLRTTYEPLSVAVRVGAQVPRGAVLGRLGTGHACGRGTCLHLGLRRGEEYLDPLRLFGGPVRLLPDGGRARDGRRVAGAGVPPAAAGAGAGPAGRGRAPVLPGTWAETAPPVLGRSASGDALVPAPESGLLPLPGASAEAAGRARPVVLPGAAGPGDGAEQPASRSFDLARDEWPLAASAALALLAGLVLVRGSGSRPPTGGAPLLSAGSPLPRADAAEAGPPVPAASGTSGAEPLVAPPLPGPVPADAPDGRPCAGVVQLDHERQRRRAG